MSLSGDGPLYVELETDLKDFQGAMEEAERRIRGLSHSSAAQAREISQSITSITEGSLQKQRDLIEAIEQEISDLQRKLKNAYSVKGIEDIERRLDEAKVRRDEAEASLDRMIQKSEEEVQVNAQVEKSQKGVIASLIEWGRNLGIVAAAATFFKAVIASSNTLTEEFENNIHGARGALQQFFQTFSAGAGQTGNPIKNMIEGFKGAKELSAAMDAYGDSMRSNQVLEASEMELLRQKEAIFRNASKENKERKQALDEWIRIKQDAAARELKIEQSLNDALVKEIQNRPNLKGITKDEISSFVTLYATDPELMQKAEQLQKLFNSPAGSGQAAVDEAKKLKAEIESLLPVGMSFDSLMSGIRINSALNDKQITALADSYKQLSVAQSGAAEVESESARWLGSIVNKGEQAVKKIKDLNTQISEQIVALNDAITAGNEAEIRSIADKIVALQQELTLREKLASVAISAAIVRDPGVTKVPVNLPGPLGQKVKLALAGAPKYTQTKEELKRENELLAEQEETRNNIARAAADLFSQMGSQLGLDENQMSLLNGTLNAFESLIRGDAPGAALQMLSGLIAQIPAATNRFAKQIEQINGLLIEQERLIDKSLRTGGTEELMQGKIDLLEKKRQTLEKRIADDQKTLDKWITAAGAKDRAFVDMMEATEQLKQLKIELENAKQEFNDFISGGITQNTVADAIANGLRDGGMQGVDTVAQYMQDELRIAAMNVFKNKILGAPLDELTSMMTASLQDKVLTEDEKSDIDEKVRETAEMYRETWDNLMGVFDDGASGVNSLSGAIKGITEQTASVLAGQVTGIRISQAESTSLIRQQLMHLSEIAHNTSYNKYLVSIDSKLDALRSDPLRAQGITA